MAKVETLTPKERLTSQEGSLVEKVGYAASLKKRGTRGYLIPSADANGEQPQPIKVERNQRNRVFFVYNTDEKRFELSGQSPYIITAVLEANNKQAYTSPEPTPAREVTFFAHDGQFYDNVSVLAFAANSGNAQLSMPTEEGATQLFEMNVGDIYCITVAAHEPDEPRALPQSAQAQSPTQTQSIAA